MLQGPATSSDGYAERCKIIPDKLREFPPILAKMADLAGCGSLFLLAELKPLKFKQAGIILHTSV